MSMNAPHKPHRGTIQVETCQLTDKITHPCDQFTLRFNAPRIAAACTAGSFIHIQCADTIPMRRPMSVMRYCASQGWLEVLFKIVGKGSAALAAQPIGAELSIIGPIGKAFSVNSGSQKTLLLGGGVGIPPMICLAEQLMGLGQVPALVVMGSEIPFPFSPVKTTQPLPGVDADIDASMPLMEQWNIPSRLTSLQGFEGCFRGLVTDLARDWLTSLNQHTLSQVQIFACGPTPMLRAVAQLANAFDRPCQVSLEEFMACGVGGCAGCTVRTLECEGPAMRRVCVDGPVFDANIIDWAALPT